MAKVIKTEKDYQKVLARIYELMNKARKNTKDGNELELLVALIETYEKEHYPISTCPGF